MTDELYRTPMAGMLSISWKMGEDEEGVPSGFVGTPRSPDDAGEALRDCVGTDIYFGTDLQAIDDESLALSLRATCLHAVGKYIMPQLITFMYDAAMELRERKGGFDAEMHRARIDELLRERDGEDSA